MFIKKGSTDKSVYLRIIDSTDGTPETGVVFNTSGIDLWYRREGAAKVSITEVTLASLTTAHTDGGFLHVGDGVYRLDPPDAAWASGATEVVFGGTVTGMIVIERVIQLTDFDVNDAVRAGLSALPNANAAANGGLPTVDASNSVKIQTNLKRNVAMTNRHVLMVDATTGVPQTGKTVSVTRIKGNGTVAAATPSTATELSDGEYAWGASASDCDDPQVTFIFTATGCRVEHQTFTFEP